MDTPDFQPHKGVGVLHAGFEAGLQSDSDAFEPRKAVLRLCEERSDEAIQSLLLALDCFAEPVIGRAFARPVGSQ
jgi:hypothetical protein